MSGENQNQDRLKKIFEELGRPTGLSELPRRIELCRQALTMMPKEIRPELWAMLQYDLASSLAQTPIGSRAENFEQAIRHFEQALEVYTPQRYPKEWTSALNNLAITYRDRIYGERAENIEKAIKYFHQALEVHIRQVVSKDWAMTHYNLAGAYYKRIRGERAENLELAIYHCEQTLDVYTLQTWSYYWAQAQNTLGEVYQIRIRGSRIENIEQAILHFKQSLEVYTAEAFPQEWAMIQHNLGASYTVRIRGERAENLQQAIQYFERALVVRTQHRYPQQWASTQHNLAIAYGNRIRGERAENIEKAIRCYEESLVVRTREVDPEHWAITQQGLAGAYYKRIRGARSENLELAIYHSQQALEVATRQAFPEDWAQAQNTLGEIYRVRISGLRMENVEQAIQHFQQALEVYTRQAFPQDWAMIQHNLGAAYIVRIRGAKAENIERAIYNCQQALEVYTRQAFPQEWASLQYNLGNAYRDRIRGDQPDNIERAIYHLDQALEGRTHQALPEDWAQTLNNLGNVYLARIRGDHGENIEQAISYYQQALKVRTQRALPQGWAETLNNLGNAFSVRVYGERADNLEQAILNYKQALEVRTRDAFPEDWAETLNNLAGAERIRGEQAEGIEESIRYLKQALEVYTRDAFPYNWARTHNNLAMVYTDRKQGERAANIDHAISHYQQALEIYTPQAFSDHCLKTARALGNLAFDERRWELARDAYSTAFGAYDVLWQASFSRESEKVELSETQNLAPRAAYAHAKLGKVEQALEIMEKSRTQLLRESFEHQRQNLERLPALGFSKLYEEYMHARDEYQALQGIEASKNIRLADWTQALEKVQDATVAIREEVGQIFPQYRYFLKALSFDKIQEQAREKPVVYLCATSAGGLALLVSEQDVQAIEIPELKQEALQQQIWRPSNEEIERINAHLQQGGITFEDIEAVRDGYFSTYALWSLVLSSARIRISLEQKNKLFESWQQTLDGTTHWLWEVVMGKLVSVLKEHHNSVTLLPAGQLALLPLHAAWTEDSSNPTGRRYALDEITISYAPSAHILWQASFAAERPAERLMIVDNPDGTLSYSKYEVQAALGAFKQATHLPGKKATVPTVKDEMEKAHVLHFSTHGRAGWERPEQAQLKLADGELTLPDIFELDLHQARLAVLSACETGVPGLELIDEMIGLPSGMMQAGVPGVVGSLWSVSDMSTAMLMARFYSFLREDCTPQEALRQSQIWLRDSTTEQKKELFEQFIDGQIVGMSRETAEAFYEYIQWKEPDARIFASPFYWAAFTYTGI